MTNIQPPAPTPENSQSRSGAGQPVRDLAPRVFSAIVMVVLAFATLWAGGQIFILFWLMASFAAFWEWQRMLHLPQLTTRMFAGAAALAICAALASGGLGDLAIVAALGGAGVVGVMSGRAASDWRAGAWAAAGTAYAAALLISILLLRLSLLHGVASILWLFAIVWGTDILAYFSGRSIGGPKLWPRVSPSKTWSGFIGGVTGGAVCGTLVIAMVLPGIRPHWLLMFGFALVLAIISQGGDLFESALKRRYGVKDSSQLIPGHGGVLDRLDGFTAAVICAAIIGASRGGLLGAANGLFNWH